MFSRKKQEATEDGPAVRTSDQDRSARKGRPTPSRREAEARRRQPLVPADRKEAKRKAKAARDAAYQREQEALVTGDERYLPLRDKGRIRRFARDWIDARWSLSEFVMPAFLVLIAAMMLFSFMRDTAAAGLPVVLVAFYAVLIVSLIEGFIVWWQLKRRIRQRFPNDPMPKGIWFYVYSRMIMLRRWRTPRPQVERGDFPETEPPH